MTLHCIPSHPSSLCYVLKLHRDSQPAQGQISGLLEHISSGCSMPFADAATLLAALLAHSAHNAHPTGISSHQKNSNYARNRRRVNASATQNDTTV